MKLKIGIIGGGNMGEAILSRVRKKYSVRCAEKNQKRRGYLKKKYRLKLQDAVKLLGWADVIVLAVKPQEMDTVLKEISDSLKKSKFFISIAAGVTTSFIEKRLGRQARVVRTMPNMPALIGEGISAVSKGKSAKTKDVYTACKILGSVGDTVVVPEKLIDAVTAVSGSGPAYVFLFAELLAQAAQQLGLSRRLAQQLVDETLLGSIHLLKQHKDDAGTLRAKVTSKGGATQAAMDVFKKMNIEKIMIRALKAAKMRARQLSRS